MASGRPSQVDLQSDASEANTDLTPLLIIGGQSSRMGTPKHLLLLPSFIPLYQHHLNLLQSAFPEAPIYVAARHPNQTVQLSPPEGIEIQYCYDDLSSNDSVIGGPAAGLLSAHANASNKTFVTLPCDHPLVTQATFERLVRDYEPSLTCFENAEGFLEPLIGIWAPEALGLLRRRCGEGKTGPSRAAKELLAEGKGRVLKVGGEEKMWLTGANTKEEWDGCLQILKARLIEER